MEDEIRHLFNNLKLLQVDLEHLQKSTRVPINAQMFQKANHKGLALLVHTLFCLFDDQNYRQQFSVCWFPYSMIEMREFKNVAERIAMELSAKGKLGATDITRATLETASGIRVWASLRTVSDAALADRLMKKPSLMGQGLPRFYLTPASAQAQSLQSHSSTSADEGKAHTVVSQLYIPAKTNICQKALARASRSLKLQNIQMGEEFGRCSEQIEREQQAWVVLAERMTSEHETLKVENKELLRQAKSMGLISSSSRTSKDGHATMSSQLAEDLKEQGIECIEKVPQIAEVREAQGLFDGVGPLLSENHLRQNIGFLLEGRDGGDTDTPSTSQSNRRNENSVSQDTILAKCEPESIPEMKKRLKYDYSDQIVDINSLCTQSLSQMDQVLYQIEAVQSDPRTITMLDKLIKQHRDALAKIDACKEHLQAEL